MRHKHSKSRMGLRGRSVFVTYMVIATAGVLALYYLWNSVFFSRPSRVTYASAQGIKQEDVEKWDRQRLGGLVIEEPPIVLNKEIEMQRADEKWSRAQALQDRIDEERLLEEQAAEHNGKKIDNSIQQLSRNQGDSGGAIQQNEGKGPGSQLYQEPDPLDGDYFAKLERLVHLDLKGAPPLVSYFEKLFPVLRKLGATGLLMEYEDMFPYTGNISILASGNAYSLSDLQRIQASAKANGLEIIPLVQTFGHMEFALKYKRFIGLREHEYTPQVITPAKEESYSFIFSILDQVLKAHPEAQRVHLGCDEVYQLGKGQSAAYIASHKSTPQKLFLGHVVKVAKHLKTAISKVKPLIWDDWLRGIPYDVLADSGVHELVEPVVWYYQHNVLERIPPTVWETYGKLFPGVWVASAFKGATGSAQILTNASVHLDNNLQWVNVVRSFGIQAKKVTFRGVILTGWQRYDHFATLCELLPVGLPSLALSLQAVLVGGFGPRELTKASHSLNCSDALDLQFPALVDKGAKVSQDCSFPGSAIFYSVQQLWGIMEVYKQDLGLQERISGWMTDYHYRQGISSPGQMKVLAHKLTKVVDKLRSMVDPMRDSLLQIYDKDTVDEWIVTNLQDRTSSIKKLLDKATKFIERKDWPARPFTEYSFAPSQMEVRPSVLKVGESQSSNIQLGHVGGNDQYNHQNLNQQQYVKNQAQGIADSKQLPIGPRQINVNAPVNPQGLANRRAFNAQSAVRIPDRGAGGVGQSMQNVNVGGQGAGKLSQTLLRSGNSVQQARPGGSGKLLNYLPPVQNVRNPDPRGRPQQQQQQQPQQVGQAINPQGLGQHLRVLPQKAQGLPQGQHKLPQQIGNSQQGLPKNLQGVRQVGNNQLLNDNRLGQSNLLKDAKPFGFQNAQLQANQVINMALPNQPNAQMKSGKEQSVVLQKKSNYVEAVAGNGEEGAGYLESFVEPKGKEGNAAPNKGENRRENVDYNADDDS